MMTTGNELWIKCCSLQSESVNAHLPNAAVDPTAGAGALIRDRRLSFASLDTCKTLGQQTPG